jgi:hypothetical protein
MSPGHGCAVRGTAHLFNFAGVTALALFRLPYPSAFSAKGASWAASAFWKAGRASQRAT